MTLIFEIAAGIVLAYVVIRYSAVVGWLAVALVGLALFLLIAWLIVLLVKAYWPVSGGILAILALCFAAGIVDGLVRPKKS